MSQQLQDTFESLCKNYSGDGRFIASLWKEIVEYYSESGRHYHTLHHLGALLEELDSCRDIVSDWNAVLFALYYHDFVYLNTSRENEERSAEEASQRLTSLHVSEHLLKKVQTLILATKSHQPSGDPDTDLFTDADLSILGSDPAKYDEYARQVRKEYWIYPGLLYNPGRRKALQHFLDMPQIFKTDHFRSRYEDAARANILREIRSLH